MLGKLLKYEVDSMGRILFPLYGLLIALATVVALNVRLSMSSSASIILKNLSILSLIILIIAVTAVFLVTVVLVIQRFYRNLLGNEGYLMFAIPANTASHIISKVLAGLLFSILGVFFGAVAGMIIVGITGDAPEFVRWIQETWRQLNSYQSTVKIIVWVILILLVALLETILKVYAAIAIGHQWGNHRIIGAILGYIGCSVAETVLMKVTHLGDLYSRFAGSDTSFLSDGHALYIIALSLAGAVIYGLISWFLLDRRLNLE